MLISARDQVACGASFHNLRTNNGMSRLRHGAITQKLPENRRDTDIQTPRSDSTPCARTLYARSIHGPYRCTLSNHARTTVRFRREERDPTVTVTQDRVHVLLQTYHA